MMEEPVPTSTTGDVAPHAPPASWHRRFWRWLTQPWFSSLLKQTVLSRVLLASVAALGGAHLLGWSLWPCTFASVTGLPCPGCGMTRAVTALLKGQWDLAMAYHPFSPGFVVMGGLLTWVALAPKTWREPVVQWVKVVEKRAALPSLFLLSVFIYGLLRMGGVCSNPAIVSPSPVRAWLQERAEVRK